MGNILTSNQLKRRGSQLSGKCYLCKVKEETMDHILLHCSKSSHALAINLCSIRCSVSGDLLSLRCPSKLAHTLCRKTVWRAAPLF